MPADDDSGADDQQIRRRIHLAGRDLPGMALPAGCAGRGECVPGAANALVIVGGAVGVAARALLVVPLTVGSAVHPLAVPAVTLGINLVGSLLLGVIILFEGVRGLIAM